MNTFPLSVEERQLVVEGLKAENHNDRRSQDFYNPYRKEELAKIREIDRRISLRNRLIERLEPKETTK